MSIQKIKRKSGYVYRARVYVRGKQVSSTFSRKIDAEEWERDKLRERDSPKGCLPEMTFRKLYDKWVRSTKNHLAKSTALRYEQLFRLYILPAFEDCLIQEIRTEDVDEWFNEVQDLYELAPKTLNHILNALKTVMHFAVSRRLLHFTPCTPIKSLPLNYDDFDFWSREEITDFLQSAKDDPNYGIYLCALNTGMRLGEILSLQWDMVALERRMITVARTWCTVDKQIKNETKGKRRRHVPINDPLMGWLVENRSRDGLVFGSRGVVLDPNHFNQNHFRPACVRYGVRTIRFHDLRHTYASHYIMNGGDPLRLQKILGHQDFKTTQRYTHLSPDYLRGAADFVSFEAPSEEENVLSIAEYREVGNK